MFTRLRALLIAAVAALLSAFLLAAPAAAHDSLVDSDPAADAVLTEAPESIRLEYSAELLDLGETSTIVMVMDAAEKDWVSGVPAVDRNVVVAQLDAGMPAGAYEIRWQVISSDGHPITGIVPFSMEGAEPAPVVETQEPEVPPMPEQTVVAAVETDSSGTPQPLRIVLLGLGGAAIAFALFFLSIRALRAVRRKESS